MQVDHLIELFTALNNREIQYLIVGGLAVNAHGYQRFTKDVDLCLSLLPEELEKAVHCLQKLEFKPTLPVPFEDFLNPQKRLDWKENRNLTVFSITSDRFPLLTIDLFAENPFPFEEVYKKAYTDRINEETELKCVDLNTLIEMKEKVARQQDLIDVEYLKKLRNEL